LFRSLIIDWLNIPDNILFLTSLDKVSKKFISNDIFNIDYEKNSIENRFIINKYIIKLMENNVEENLGFLELLILNHIHKIPIVFIINGIPKYLINSNIKIIKTDNYLKYCNSSNICIAVDVDIDNKYPSIIESIYYKN